MRRHDGGSPAQSPTSQRSLRWWGRSSVAQSVPSQLGADPELAMLTDLLARQGLHTVYQPVVELDTGHIVGYEALSRGPRSSQLESPEQLFAAARRANQLAELDRACQAAAMAGAATAGLRAPCTLFVNVEPEVAATAPQSCSAKWLPFERAAGASP